MLKENEIYVILFDYSDDDLEDNEIYLYKDKKDALLKFKSIIKDEEKYYKDNYDNYPEGFTIDTNIDDGEYSKYFWNVTHKYDFNIHTFLDLRIKEIR